jgi:hypothetical protein
MASENEHDFDTSATRSTLVSHPVTVGRTLVRSLLSRS